jgi:fibronectin type 3 domain-containing protein
MISIVLLSVTGLLLGCSDDDTVAPNATVNEAPPAIVMGLAATMTPAGIELTWIASSQPNLGGYNVYRHISSTSAITKINSSLVGENRYIDTTAQNGPVYEYLVTAVTVRGTESAYAAITINTSPERTKAEIYVGH